MKILLRSGLICSFVLAIAFFLASCTAKPADALPSATPAPSTTIPKNGDYPSKGKVTKIDLKLGSVEMDHEEIVGVMPPMRMEFFVSDKKLLDGLSIGDKVDFILRYKDGTEIVIDIKKAK